MRLGTLDLHRATVGVLSRDQLADAVVLAGLATEIVLHLLDPDGRDHDTEVGEPGAGEDATGMAGTTLGWLPGVHAEVHQASGMVSGREGIGVDQALLRIRAHAFAQDEPIEQVARRIVDRDLVLDQVAGTRDDGRDGRDGGPAGPDLERDR